MQLNWPSKIYSFYFTHIVPNCTRYLLRNFSLGTKDDSIDSGKYPKIIPTMYMCDDEYVLHKWLCYLSINCNQLRGKSGIVNFLPRKGFVQIIAYYMLRTESPAMLFTCSW